MGEGRAPHDVEQNSLLEESQAGTTAAASFKGNFLGESRKQGRGGPDGQLEALDEKRNSLELLSDKVSVNVGTMHRPVVLGAKKENDVEAADGGLWSICRRCRADWVASLCTTHCSCCQPGHTAAPVPLEMWRSVRPCRALWRLSRRCAGFAFRFRSA